ncbi:MAG: YidB family protein [Defluviicoccus sp.]|nr:YidB family protein [Defluviicoccus sp.]
MGLLDGLAGQVLGGLLGGGQGGQGAQGNQLLQLALALIQNQQGGLGGLLQQFQRAGMGDQAASWISTGENMPISGDQLSQALGGGAIGNIASQLGLSQEQTSGALASVLPQLIDQLTPEGKVTEGDALQEALGGLAGKLFR